jgi:DNA-binding transcriptional ArsR family regulator
MMGESMAKHADEPAQDAPETSPATPAEAKEEPAPSPEEHRTAVKRSLGDVQDYTRAADLFQVLADPTRLRLIAAMARAPLCVGDLSQVVELGQSATSHALRILRDRGIAQATRAGQMVRYGLADSGIRRLLAAAWAQSMGGEPPEALRLEEESREKDGRSKKKKKKKKKKHK